MSIIRRALQLSVIVLALALLDGSLAAYATIDAKSCNAADVQSAVNAAQHGDTVVIPAGACTWTSGVTVTKGIYIRGQGDATVLRDDAPGAMIAFHVDQPHNGRLSHLTVVGVREGWHPNVHVMFGGTQTAFRIHNVTFTAYTKPAVGTTAAATGLVDNNSFVSGSIGASVFVSHPAWGGSAYGDGSWAAPLTWGGTNQVVIEDNYAERTGLSQFNQAYGQFTDALDGARFTVRYNTLRNRNVGSHGTDSGGRRRSVRQMEVYHNTFEQVHPFGLGMAWAVWIRGGTGVVFNNTVTKASGDNANQLLHVGSCRWPGSCGSVGGGVWGICDGTSKYDQNASPSVPGYRCVDQQGAGTSNHLNGAAVPTAQWVGNVLDPIYVWNNTGAFKVDVGGHKAGYVDANRDYYVGTPRPNYKPLTYPHPLRQSEPPSTAPSPPKHLRITG
jgi:hypothetical protein